MVSSQRSNAGGCMTLDRLDQDHLDAIERTAFRVTRCMEDAQIVCTEVLEELDSGAFESFDGRSSLRTWLIAMARNKAIDLRHKRLGRRSVPHSVCELGRTHRELFRLYFIDGLPYSEVRAALLRMDLITADDAIATLLGEILDVLDPRTLHRIHWDRPGAMIGPDDGRLLEFHAEMRRQAAERSATLDLEFDHREERTHRTLAALAEYRKELPDDERLMLEMKYERNMSAKEIADVLGLQSARRVYTMLDRSLRTLRRLLTAAGLSTGLLGLCILLGDFWTHSVQ